MKKGLSLCRILLSGCIYIDRNTGTWVCLYVLTRLVDPEQESKRYLLILAQVTDLALLRALRRQMPNPSIRASMHSLELCGHEPKSRNRHAPYRTDTCLQIDTRPCRCSSSRVHAWHRTKIYVLGFNEVLPQVWVHLRTSSTETA